MLLESSSLPIPSEVVLPFAGYLVSMGQLNLWITVIVATIAGIAGSLVDYYIGLKGVQSLTQHRVLGRVLFSANQLEIAARWFNKHGALNGVFRSSHTWIQNRSFVPCWSSANGIAEVYGFHHCRLLYYGT